MRKETNADVEAVRTALSYNPKTGVFTWLRGRRAGKAAGWVQRNGNSRGSLSYVFIEVKGRRYRAHRLAFVLMGEDMPTEVDHIDGDSLNNAWENLKAVSAAENTMNRRIRCDNQVGLAGVYWEPERKRWRARIGVAGKMKTVALTKDFFEACCARLGWANRLGYSARHGR